MENAYDQAILKIKRATGKPKKVLILDDELIIRSGLKSYFLGNGCEVLDGGDGVDGIQLYQDNNDIDLIITDLKMPNMNGVEFIKLVRETDTAIPIIVLTGYPDYDGIQQITSSGWIILIGKPFELKNIGNIFTSLFEGK